MPTGIFVTNPPTSFPVDTPTTVELRVLSVLIQSLLGNGTQAIDDLKTIRTDQSAPGN
jgi:hypothetical protein